MAKALLGHVGGPDPRVVADLHRLQRRVRDLEAEVVRLQAANDALTATVRDGDDALAAPREPALT